MRTLLFNLITLLLCSSVSFAQEMKKNNLLILLAHPDDETLIAQYLITLDRYQWEPTIVYLTSGEGGSDRRWSKEKPIKDRKGLLRQTRSLELKKSMQILDIKNYYVLGVPDRPYRVPFPNYPNPLGKPTTDLKIFFKNVLEWNPIELESKLISFFRDKKLLTSTHLLTMCDCKGVTHAHHQAVSSLAKSLVQKNVFPKLKQAWQFGEQKSYPHSKLSIDNKKSLRILKASEMNESEFKKYSQVYQAHDSQNLSTYDKNKLKTFSEYIWDL